tara:strand:- start:27 stop:1778 length:1752 start_codon:yes stop_codon:yes gene_type:complete
MEKLSAEVDKHSGEDGDAGALKRAMDALSREEDRETRRLDQKKKNKRKVKAQAKKDEFKDRDLTRKQQDTDLRKQREANRIQAEKERNQQRNLDREEKRKDREFQQMKLDRKDKSDLQKQKEKTELAKKNRMLELGKEREVSIEKSRKAAGSRLRDGSGGFERTSASKDDDATAYAKVGGNVAKGLKRVGGSGIAALSTLVKSAAANRPGGDLAKAKKIRKQDDIDLGVRKGKTTSQKEQEAAEKERKSTVKDRAKNIARIRKNKQSQSSSSTSGPTQKVTGFKRISDPAQKTGSTPTERKPGMSVADRLKAAGEKMRSYGSARGGEKSMTQSAGERARDYGAARGGDKPITKPLMRRAAVIGARKLRTMGRRLQREELIYEVEDMKKDKVDKIIDIMRGKNKVEVNPKISESHLLVQDLADYKPLEIETVDLIKPEPLKASDWRNEISEEDKKIISINKGKRLDAKKQAFKDMIDEPYETDDKKRKDYGKKLLDRLTKVDEGAAWTKKAGKNKSGGLNEKGRKSYERENPGSDLKAPSKKVGNPRRKSFCARMKGMKKKLTSSKTANDPNSRINKSLRAWNC